MIAWLREDEPFPPVDRALRAPNGLLAASDALTPAMLRAAYRRGIFPWSSDGEPVLWWSPDPRLVLYTEEFKIARSFRKRLALVARGDEFTVRVDAAFERVMRACAAPRPGQDGTWITAAVIDGYLALHRRGLAHSVELWRADTLVGGLYGVALGRMFFGESMFSPERDRSKIALAALVRLLAREGVRLVDCQQNTRHLISLGAREITRSGFCEHVAKASAQPAIDWECYARERQNSLLAEQLQANDG